GAPRVLPSFPTRRSSDLLVVLLAVVVSMWISLRERVPLWHWHDWSPEGVLRYRIRLCESTLRFAAMCRASGLVLLLFAAYLWIRDRKSTRLNSSHVKISY